LSAAIPGIDYSAGTSALASGILKSTTATGTLSIATATDFPILNQNTTGNAATVTTNANLTGDVTSVGNATTLATVNSNVGTFSSVTVNAKGLVTAASNSTIKATVAAGTTSIIKATTVEVAYPVTGVLATGTAMVSPSTATTIPYPLSIAYVRCTAGNVIVGYINPSNTNTALGGGNLYITVLQ
jgi:hypothetical protein